MRSREGSKCFSRAGHCTGCFAHVSLSNSWSFQYPHFKGGEQETQRSSNKLPHVIQLSAEAGVWTQFRFLWPIQFVLFTQPTSGSAARILLALPWRIYLFLKRVISLRATFDFFFLISIIYPEHNYALEDERESVLTVKHLVYYGVFCSALSTLCPWRMPSLPAHGGHLPAQGARPRGLAANKESTSFTPGESLQSSP